MRSIVVTGGSRGIGLATVEHYLASDEYDCVVGISRVAPVFKSSHAEGKFIYISSDLSTETGVGSACETLENLGIKIGALVNNAGSVMPAEIDEVSFDQMNMAFTLHAYALAAVTRTAVKKRAADGIDIVNIGSIYGGIADPNVAAYSMSKAVVPILTRIQAIQYAAYGRVNCVLPGHVNTDMTRGAPADFIASVLSATPAARIGEVGDIVDVIIYLLSPAAGFVTGACIPVDGGYGARSGS